MNEAKDILTLLGIPSEKVKIFYIENNKEFVRVYIELYDIRSDCPQCGSKNIGIKDYYKVEINNSIIKHQKMIIEIRVRRYFCKDCGKTFKQNYDLYEPQSSISIAVKGAILDDLKERLTFTQIAKDHNISINTVITIFDKNVLEQLPLPLSEIICVDEFCYKHKGSKYVGKYPYVITNPLTGEIIDIVQSRWKSILFDYFKKIDLNKRKKVKYFVSDMNETSRQVKNKFFHDATHIADRFHVVKCFNEAITSIRTRIIKQEIYYKTSEAKYLKKNWKIFLTDRDELKKKKKVDKYGVVIDPTIGLDGCLKKYPDLFYAYWTKEEFRKETKELMRHKQADNLICFYINKLSNSTIEEMVKIGKTFTNWKQEIINGITKNLFSIKISNAIAEATNNQIQTIIDLCYGLPNFKRMRKRVILINRSECLRKRKQREANGK